MKKRFTKLLAIILSLVITAVIIPGGTFVVSGLTNSEYVTKYQSFISDARWCNGAAWGARSPYISPYGSSGCCAYAADYAYYVHGKSNFSSCSISYNASEIQVGDVISGTWTSGAGPHWIVVLSRSGNTLYTAEGNLLSKVRVTNSGYTISGANLYEPYNGTLSISAIYHFEISPDHSHSYSSSITKQSTCTENGVRTYTCSCGASYTEDINKLGHDYVTTVTEPTCTDDGYTTYACSRCNSTYISEITPRIDHSYVLTNACSSCDNTAVLDYCCSDCKQLFQKNVSTSNGKTKFIEEKIDGISDDCVEEKIQYRSSEKETTTSTTSKELDGWEYEKTEYSVYGAWSDWQDASIASDELTSVQSDTFYPWYTFICPHCGQHDPFWGLKINNCGCSNCGEDILETDSIIYWLNIPWDTKPAYSFGSITYDDKRTFVHDQYGVLWSDKSGQRAIKTMYRKQTRTSTNYFYKWSEFSDWQDEPIIADENTQVETRTLYSYDLSANITHSYETEWSSNGTQHWRECTNCIDKVDLSNHIYDNDSDSTCNICGYVRMVVVPEKPVDENASQIVVSSGRVTLGKTINVTVAVKNNPGIASATLRLNYDSSVFTLTSVTDGGILGTAVHKPELSSPYTLAWANDTATTDFTQNGTLATLTFTVDENAAEGTYPISISYSYDDYDIYNVNVEPINIALVNGSIDVVDVIIGDVNGDGKVNNLDRVFLTRYLADWADYTEENCDLVAADVNCDGKVNNLDRVILTRYLADWDDYPELPYAG